MTVKDRIQLAVAEGELITLQAEARRRRITATRDALRARRAATLGNPAHWAQVAELSEALDRLAGLA